MKRALVVGIDHYGGANDLHGCVNDARGIASILACNADGSPNFDVLTLLSCEGPVESNVLYDAVAELMHGTAEVVLLYFAGHGILNHETGAAFLITQDGRSPNWGLSLAEVLERANNAHPRISSTVIILDSCQSGYAGEVAGLGTRGAVSVIGNGVTILTACAREGTAAEAGNQGAFTSILLDGLNGAAADVLGRITPASLYSHVDQMFGAWDQRPVYKANVGNFLTLRTVEAKVQPAILRRLHELFPTPDHEYSLDPSHEPYRGEEAARLEDIAISDENVRTYHELQQCNRHGLVVPVAHDHMWHAAVHSGRVQLTATGKHYRRLAQLRRI